MREYQYYAFLSIERPLTQGQMDGLRAISNRARINATSFVNVYNYGDFHGSPAQLMEDCFDAHLYFANWGARYISIKFPKNLVDIAKLFPFMVDDEFVSCRTVRNDIILDVTLEGEESEYDWYEEEDFSPVTAALSSLRADLLAGDLRLFYIVWLMMVDKNIVHDDVPEPLPGIGSLTGPLSALANFFGIDQDLLTVATQGEGTVAGNSHLQDLEQKARAHDAIAGMSGEDRTAWLLRFYDNEDSHLAVSFRRQMNDISAPGNPEEKLFLRTAGEIRSLIGQAGKERAVKEEAEKAVILHRQKLKEEADRTARLEILARRRDSAWDEVEDEIMCRSAESYDRAITLIGDLQVLADQQDTQAVFRKRVNVIHSSHYNKKAFIVRLDILLSYS